MEPVAMMEFDFSFPIRVYVEDTDAGGIVYYVNYLKFMERGRTEFMRSIGFEQALDSTSSFQFVVHSADVKYLKPARMDMLLNSTLRLQKIARSYLVFEQQIIDAEDEGCYCSATIKIACVNNDGFKPMAMPKHVRESVQAFLTKGSD